jgi:hypothetical protein
MIAVAKMMVKHFVIMILEMGMEIVNLALGEIVLDIV